MSEYKSYRELLEADETTLDCDEMIRLHRIREIPEAVRVLVEKRLDKLAGAVITLEKERDALMDFLNGEVDKR